MSKIPVTIGIDIGGTNTVYGFVTKSGKIVYESSFPTRAEREAEDLFERLFFNINKASKKISKNYEILGIGIGAPNANYYKGIIDNPPNLKWGKVNALKLVKKYTSLPSVITNDANIAALGEMLFGSAKNMKNFVVITLGTGVGSGIIVDGKRLDGKVVGLIGVDTYQSFTDDYTPEQKEGFLHSFNENFVNSTIEFVKSMFPPNADQILVEKISQDMSQAPPRVATSAMRNLFYYNPIPSLKEIDLPIISINCDLYPVNIEENKKHVKSFEVKTMKGVGHFIMLERPEEFNFLLSEAINELIKE